MNNSENTTIKDIAKKANVSVATAGRVMGNYGRTSESTKTKVLQAAKELNYVRDSNNINNLPHSLMMILVLSDF